MSNELELLDDDFVKIVKNVIPKEVNVKLISQCVTSSSKCNK